jgi:NADH-quinone oxidoreductase subunit J
MILLNIPVTLYLFYFLSFLALMCGLMVVFSKNPVHSVLYLVITFFSIAGHYILLNAQFLAVVHIVVYAGAIMVLFLFVIMLLNLNEETEPQKKIVSKISAVVAGGLMLVTLTGALKGSETMYIKNPVDGNVGLVNRLGSVLFNEFLFPFEIASVLLLAAMVGAIMIAKKENI